MKRIILPIIATTATLLTISCKPTGNSRTELIIQELETTPFKSGITASITVIGGVEYKYPIMAIWAENMNGEFIGTLYASKSIATGIFRYGVYDKGKWLPGERNRPAALPRWKHKVETNTTLNTQNVDGFSGATPSTSFTLKTLLPKEPSAVKFYIEVNKPWDFNSYWHNKRFPDDEEYATSGQPALIYEATVDTNSNDSIFAFKPIGHSHPSGKTDEIFNDISTFTSALKIIDKAWIKIKKYE